MNVTASEMAPDTGLARTALALVISSILLPFIVALAVVFASNPAQFIADDPSRALFIGVAASAYGISLVALYRLRQPTADGHRLRRWIVSLVATLAIVATFLAAFGLLLGVLVGALEIVAVAVHLRAIALLA